MQELVVKCRTGPPSVCIVHLDCFVCVCTHYIYGAWTEENSWKETCANGATLQTTWEQSPVAEQTEDKYLEDERSKSGPWASRKKKLKPNYPSNAHCRVPAFCEARTPRLDKKSLRRNTPGKMTSQWQEEEGREQNASPARKWSCQGLQKQLSPQRAPRHGAVTVHVKNKLWSHTERGPCRALLLPSQVCSLEQAA